MSAPRHLWSGDWQLDSAAVAEELANRRAQTDEPIGTEPELPDPPSRPSAAERATAWLVGARQRLRRPDAGERPRGRTPRKPSVPPLNGRDRELRAAVLVALLVLLTAATAFGVTLLVTGSDGQSSAAVNRAHAWLGIDVSGSPSGVVVTVVVQGSPAQAAGLQPGDLIVQINNQPIGTVDGVDAALNGLSAGAQIDIQFSRGPVNFTTQATLTARPPGSP